MLSDDRIAEMMRDTWGCASIAPRHAEAFARSVEAEVRKDDEALIRQLTDLVQAQHDYIMALPADVVAPLPAMPGFDGDWADEIKAAARARLEWLGKLDQHLEGLAGSHTQ